MPKRSRGSERWAFDNRILRSNNRSIGATSRSAFHSSLREDGLSTVGASATKSLSLQASSAIARHLTFT